MLIYDVFLHCIYNFYVKLIFVATLVKYVRYLFNILKLCLIFKAFFRSEVPPVHNDTHETLLVDHVVALDHIRMSHQYGTVPYATTYIVYIYIYIIYIYI